jgi:hypothetical protein
MLVELPFRAGEEAYISFLFLTVRMVIPVMQKMPTKGRERVTRYFLMFIICITICYEDCDNDGMLLAGVKQCVWTSASNLLQRCNTLCHDVPYNFADNFVEMVPIFR